MKQLKNTFKNFWKDESGQGATEYILLLVVVVALVIAFKTPILNKMDSVMNNLSGKMDEVLK